MKKLILSTGLTLSLFLSPVVNAELIEADWKTEGDGLITIDSETGLKWLDVSYTDNVAISTVMNELSTTYQGWSIADASQVNGLMFNQFGLTSEGETSSEKVQDWQYHFGITGTGGRSYGSYVIDGRTRMSGTRDNGTVYIHYGRSTNQSNPNDYDGVFLVSSDAITLNEINNNIADVSVPMAVSSMAFLGLIGFRHRKNKT